MNITKNIKIQFEYPWYHATGLTIIKNTYRTDIYVCLTDALSIHISTHKNRGPVH